MSDLQMLTQEEVAELLHCHVNTITLLIEVGIIPAIRTGKHFMFSQEEIRLFQKDYRGMDVSNKFKALQSFKLVSARKQGLVVDSVY